ncbi:NAD(P)-binding protein [Lentinula aciculospora]|uniref:NAD(P)-binding protein n=1 Tax=Lentinula aciculospora TaxID=153920 RepID=A0A9W9ASM3_9AGAR|nr:NAD(P)-binding protein [Lentinula aciculospora]
MAAKSFGVALITGASQGIGKAIASRLANDGFRIALNDIPSKDQQLKILSREIERQSGMETYVAPADVTNEREVENMVEQTSKALGGLDVMIANAGIFPEGKMVIDLPAETLHKTFAVNLDGVFFCYKHAARQMIAQGRGGRILGASSIAGRRSAGHFSAYTASKYAVRGLTQSLAMELAQHGITVDAYAPGLINSPMSIELQKDHVAVLAIVGLCNPVNFKFGEPEDIASLVSYLVSKEAHYITGKCT